MSQSFFFSVSAAACRVLGAPVLVLVLLGLVGVVPAFAAPPSALPSASAPGAVPPGIAAFQAAWERVRTGQPDQADPADLRHLQIYPYLVAARLARDLRSDDAAAADAQVAAFLKAHAGEPVARRLTRNWMRSLARRKDWAGLLTHYDAARDTAKLQCQRFHARIATGDTQGLISLVKRAYVTGHTRPACKAAFDWLKAQGALSVGMIKHRAQLALKARNVSLARYLAKGLPTASATPVERWAALISTPEKALRAAIDQPHRKLPHGALKAGFSRLVRSDVDAAQQIYPDLLKARRLRGTAARPFTRLLALGLAWDRRPESVSWFKRLGAVHGDLKVQEWRIRAALWNHDWNQAQAWLEALPRKQAQSPRWQYWLARADEQLGAAGPAKTIYSQIAEGQGYYALLASWRLGHGYAPATAPLVDRPKLDQALLGLAGVQRAHELFQAGLSSRAGLEWRVALAQATPDERLQAVHLAHGWGWYAQSIATAARQGVYHAYDLLYPLPYAQAVQAAAATAELPPDWVYGVIRQESLYNPRAVSRSGALGLMQLMPATAKAVARRNEIPVSTSRAALFDPSVNIRLGTTHLRELLDRENDSFVVVLASYNAGVHAAEHWLPKKALAADVWIENIPYDETRGYVQRVLWHVAIFGWERNDKPQNISAFLAPVGPGDA